ncbi:GNAT family N-acetyltransferase [Candidatus Woesearchaeota archaeon]|nr:GNAT family N-acetyltransferase [Candidatus Woesearchaeota archaeon]
MIIKAKQFILRYPKLSDAKRNFEVQQDKETAMNFRSHPETLKQAIEEIESAIKENRKKNKTSENFAIEVDGEFAGSISIHHIVPNHKCAITYNLDKKYRGRGIVSEAVKLITNYAFKKYKLVRIEAGLRAYNIASKKVLEKNGFELEGIRKKCTKKDGRYYDDLSYAKVK